MKKLPLLFTFFAIGITSFAQDPTIEDGVLISSSGFKVMVGDYIKLGTGSSPDGDYRFVRVNDGSLFNEGNNKENDLNRKFVGRKYKVVKTRKRGNKRHGYSYVAIINIGLKRYEIDVDNAISSGEIVVPDEFKPKSKVVPAVINKNISVADELAKFKKLRDEGAITEDEYQAQKKKLLDE